MLSGEEYRRLKAIRRFREGSIDSPPGCTMRTIDALSGGKCPFLADGGCILGSAERPLVCRMFPVTYTLGKGGLRFHLSKFCPHADVVLKLGSWLAETKKAAAEELKDAWSGREVRCFGGYLRKREGELIDLQ
jgi:Fe-S-cluster containining protein